MSKTEVEKAVTAKVEEKTGSSNAELIKEIIEAVMPAAVAAVAAGQQKGNEAKSKKPKCLKCGQPEMACEDKHVQMIVFVPGPYSKWFQGCRVNGVTYLSSHPAHAITVPALNDFGYRMEQFRASEERFATGRNFEHNSGTLGPNNTGNYVPAHGPTY